MGKTAGRCKSPIPAGAIFPLPSAAWSSGTQNDGPSAVEQSDIACKEANVTVDGQA